LVQSLILTRSELEHASFQWARSPPAPLELLPFQSPTRAAHCCMQPSGRNALTEGGEGKKTYLGRLLPAPQLSDVWPVRPGLDARARVPWLLVVARPFFPHGPRFCRLRVDSGSSDAHPQAEGAWLASGAVGVQRE
jgi:hypothetical protein